MNIPHSTRKQALSLQTQQDTAGENNRTNQKHIMYYFVRINTNMMNFFSLFSVYEEIYYIHSRQFYIFSFVILKLLIHFGIFFSPL